MADFLNLLIVAGARPNFMKVAPLIRAIQRRNQLAEAPLTASQSSGSRSSSHTIQYKLVHTGQHYDPVMSEVFFQELQIPKPDFNLEVGSGSHAVQTANIMTRFEPVCMSVSPDWVVVVGDVNSTMACTLVASKLGFKVAHIEAGLRSFDRTMPEEINRLVTDVVADLLLTTSEDANENLLREGVDKNKVRFVGNIMIDALIDNLPGARRSEILKRLGVQAGRYIYVTLHRPANVDNRDSLSAIITDFKAISENYQVVFPIHPRTRRMLTQYRISVDGIPGLHIIDPIGYHDSLHLTENARLVLTDSGGLQEESTYFRTPCLTLRPNTERPVTISLGSNRLTSVERLGSDLAAVMKKEPRLGSVPPSWDGKTSERILHHLMSP